MNNKKYIKKRIVVLLSMVIVAGTLMCLGTANEVHAAGTVKDINFGVPGVTNPGTPDNSSRWGNGEGSYVYFGNYFQETTVKEPIKWRVLDTSEGNRLFLMSDKILDCQIFNTNATVPTANEWQGSGMQYWLNLTFPAQAFGTIEQAAIETTTKAEGETLWWEWYNPVVGARSSAVNDKIFILSANEVNGVNGFAGDGMACQNSQYVGIMEGKNDMSRRVTATTYAKSRDRKSVV